MGSENMDFIPSEGRKVPPKETLSQIEGDEPIEDGVELTEDEEESLEDNKETPRARKHRAKRILNKEFGL